MKQVALMCPESYLEALDFLVNVVHMYPNRNEAVRIAIKDLLQKHGEFVIN